MSVVSAIFTYLMIWWVALFVVLPFGNAPLENPLPGNEPNAPANMRMGKKLIYTSILAFFIWILVYSLIRSGFFSFREMAAHMPD